MPRPRYLHPSRGEDNQGGGEDTLGNFNPPGVKLPAGILTPGVKLPRGQDKPVHRRKGRKPLRSAVECEQYKVIGELIKLGADTSHLSFTAIFYIPRRSRVR